MNDTVNRLMSLADEYAYNKAEALRNQYETWHSRASMRQDDAETDESRKALEAELVRLFTPFSDEQIKQTVGAGGEYWALVKIYIKAIFQAAEKAHGIGGVEACAHLQNIPGLRVDPETGNVGIGGAK